jgi:hypothetical protein
LIKDFSPEELEKSYEKNSGTDVVNDINALAPPSAEKIYRQFLQFIVEYLPRRSYELVSAYAKSSSQEACREALIVAANSAMLSDILMDAWVDASNFDTNRLNENGVLLPDCNNINNPIIEGLVLAFLRRLQNRSDDMFKIDGIIKKWGFGLPLPLETVYKFCIGEIKEDNFLTKFDANEFTFAIRAKAKFERVLNNFKTHGVNKVPLCWLLATIPPSRDSIIELLKLDKKKRAVFGLCTPEEWQLIQRDDGNERQILDCRRKRKLMYRY